MFPFDVSTLHSFSEGLAAYLADEFLFLFLDVDDLGLDRVLGDQLVDVNFLCLTDPARNETRNVKDQDSEGQLTDCICRWLDSRCLLATRGPERRATNNDQQDSVLRMAVITDHQVYIVGNRKLKAEGTSLQRDQQHFGYLAAS